MSFKRSTSDGPAGAAGASSFFAIILFIDKADDDKVEDRHDERAIGKDCRARLFRRRKRGRVGAGKIDEHIREVHPAHDKPDDRVDKIADKAVDDRGKGRTDDDTYGKVHHIAFHEKGLEFLNHNCSLKLLITLLLVI